MLAPTPVSPLEETLRERTRPGELFERLDDGSVKCQACGHLCRVRPGQRGICFVRYHDGETLRVPWGYVGGLQVDPIEKKPFFHALPGARALSFGMLGCDLKCPYCQNAETSQVLRDPAMVAYPQDATPEDVVRLARRHGAEVVTSTYNEPLITSEWGAAVMRAAKEAGLVGSYVSNGNGTPEVLEYIRPCVDLYKVDLKGYDPRRYTELGGRLGNVLRTIRLLVRMDFWVEIVTLSVPGFNDSDEEFERIAEFLASVSPDLPWHVTAFHPDYKMTDRGGTPAETLLRAARAGEAAGLRYVYAGNIPGAVGRYENTRCPGCGATLIRRRHFTVLEMRVRDGACPDCRRPIPGFWRTREGYLKVPIEKAPVQAAWERGEVVDLPESQTVGPAA